MIDGKQDIIPTKYLKTTNIVHADGSRLKLGNLPGYTPAYIGNSIKRLVAFGNPLDGIHCALWLGLGKRQLLDDVRYP